MTVSAATTMLDGRYSFREQLRESTHDSASVSRTTSEHVHTAENCWGREDQRWCQELGWGRETVQHKTDSSCETNKAAADGAPEEGCVKLRLGPRFRNADMRERMKARPRAER